MPSDTWQMAERENRYVRKRHESSGHTYMWYTNVRARELQYFTPFGQEKKEKSTCTRTCIMHAAALPLRAAVCGSGCGAR